MNAQKIAHISLMAACAAVYIARKSDGIELLVSAFGGFRNCHCQPSGLQQRLNVMIHCVEYRFDTEIVCDLLPGAGCFAEDQQVRFSGLFTPLNDNFRRSGGLVVVV